MVAACPSCEARYRVDESRLPAEGARLRCSRCQVVFRVRAPAKPAAEAARPAPAAPQPAAPPATPAHPAPEAAPRAPGPERASPPSAAQRERRVLVAHAEVESAKRIADALGPWGLEVRLAHDGVEAILGIQRSLPRLVVLDAALPKMFGFQVCELVKRNESLREIAVVLVGAVHDESRYRRPPGDPYGADAYLQPQQIPEGLVPLMRSLGVEPRKPARPAASAAPAAPPAVAPSAAPSAAPRPAPAAPASVAPPQAQSQPGAAPPSAPAEGPERADAERLARIIVSDIVLYNAERFEAAIRGGEVVNAMAEEVAEGRELLSSRVGNAELADGLLEAELLRVARSRGLR